MPDLLIYEKELYKKNISLIAGVDEVGRGPLVGPVVAAAVILPKNYELLGLTDSKKLSEKKRDAFYEILQTDAIAKVTRDKMMYDLDKIYPEYGFAKHKGYPTKQHLQAIKKYGVLDNYRFSYKPVKNVVEEKSLVNS